MTYSAHCFDIETAEIPERFTRARRRQLELEVLRAEQEKKRRKEALDAAKEQLRVTKDLLRTQRQILSQLEKARNMSFLSYKTASNYRNSKPTHLIISQRF